MTEIPLRRIRCRVLPAIASALAFAGSLATQGAPHFSLPAAPYDYLAVRAPAGLPGLSLRERSDPAADARVNARATLGRVLFYDRRLSQNGKRSCSSCHQQQRAFADGKPRSSGFRGRKTRRNSMAITNLRYHEGPLFWDGRSSRLEELVLMPIQDPVEMGLGLDELVQRLAADEDYAPLFESAFGSPAVTTERIGQGLAEFVRAITSFGSRFDEGLAAAGDVKERFPNFTAAENRGKDLFFGVDGDKAHSCAICHVQVDWGWCGHSFWFRQPMFDSTSCSNNGLDKGRRRDDPGLAGFSDDPDDQGKFRAPSLRNVELTGPYMHDGRLRTLEQVVDFYATGVNNHPRLDPLLAPRKTGGGWAGSPTAPPVGMPISPMATTTGPGFPMSRRDRRDLVAFLKTLTDRALLEDPRFSDPFVEQ